MKNILVIGGAGYIGSHIADLLCEREYNVLIYDNLVNGFKENLNPESTFIFGDITDVNELEKVFLEYSIDSIIHMAALKSVEGSSKNSSEYSFNNIIGSINVISLAIKYNVSKFIFSSTAAVYGAPSVDIVDENCHSKPINHYGFTKHYVEKYLSWISSIQDIKFVIFRYFNAAGYSTKKGLISKKESSPDNLLPIVMEVANNSRPELKIFGDNYPTKDGTCIRDYIHVLDLADAHIRAINFLDSNNSEIINLSTGFGYSVLDVVKIAREITNKEIKYKISSRRDGDPASLIANSQKARRLLKWTPQYSIQEIIESMWLLYR